MEAILPVEGTFAVETMPEIDIEELLNHAEILKTEEDSNAVNTGKYIAKILEELKSKFGKAIVDERSNKLIIIKHIISWGQSDSKAGGVETDDISSSFKIDEGEVKLPSDDIPTSWSSRFGSVVWSKLSKTSPWWPSFICDPSLLESRPLQIQALKESEKKYLVYYYGESCDNAYGFVKESQIEEYLDHREEYETQLLETKKKTLIKALPLADSEAVLPVESRRIWVNFLKGASQLSDKKDKSVSKKRDIKSLDDDKEDTVDGAILEKKIRGPYKKKIKDDGAEMTIEAEEHDEEHDEEDDEGKNGVQVKPEKRGRPSGLTYKKRVLTSNIDDSKSSAVELNDLSKKKRGRPSLPALALSSTMSENATNLEPIRKEATKRLSRHSNPTDEMELEGTLQSIIPDKIQLSSDDQTGDLDGEETMSFDTLDVGVDKSSIKELPKKVKKGYVFLDKEKDGNGDSLIEARSEISNIEDKSTTSEHVQISKGRGRPSKNQDENFLSPYMQAKKAREAEALELQKDKKVDKKVANDNSTAVNIKRNSRRSRTSDEENKKAFPDTALNNESGLEGSVKEKDMGNESSVETEMNVEAEKEEKVVEYEERQKNEEEEAEAKKEEEEEEELIKSTVGRRTSIRVKYDDDDDDDYDYTQISEIKKKDGRGRPKGSVNKTKSDTNADPNLIKRTANLVKNKVKETKTRGRPRRDKSSDEKLNIDEPGGNVGDRKGGRVLPKRLVAHKKLIQEESDDDEDDEDEEEEDEEEEEEVEAVTIEVPPPRAEESRLERLSRLLNILKMNVKPTVTNIDKALLTITKIDVLDLSVEELKESGTAEVIASLRKHPNATLAARAKQLRAKWIQGVRGTQAIPMSSSTPPVPVPSNPSVVVITASATSSHPDSASNINPYTNPDANPEPTPTPMVSDPDPRTLDASTDSNNLVTSSSCYDGSNKTSTNPNACSVISDDSQMEGNIVKDTIQLIAPQIEGKLEDIDFSCIFSCLSSIPSTGDGEKQRGLNELLPESVKVSVVRSRSVKMLLCALALVQDDDIIRTAIWLEDRIYETLCATAIQANNHVLSLASSLTLASAGVVGGGKTGGDATAASQGAGSAFNRYLATVTRLTFALQMAELSTLRNAIAHIIQMNKQDDKKEISTIYSNLISSILAKNVSEILEVNTVIR